VAFHGWRAARGNPGEAGCGAAICDARCEIVREIGRYLGHATNNIAEYEILLIGLEAVIQMGRKRFGRTLVLLRHFDAYRILHTYRGNRTN